jgi:hypothetical protein
MGMVPYSDLNNQTYFLKKGNQQKGVIINGYSTAMQLIVSITAIPKFLLMKSIVKGIQRCIAYRFLHG